MRIAAAVLCGFFMDLCLGDPDWMPHPVIYMGKAISALEKFLRRRFPDTQKGLLMAGAALAAILPLGSFLMAAAAIYLAGLVHPVLAFLLETLWCWQALAVKGLYTESMRVKKKLEEQDLPGARSAVARIVGRDTQNLDAAGVAKAAIETVAENFSDGVAAPLFYLVIGGAPLGLCYKAINTMDSMVGYKNDRYLYFGRAAAKLDDIANYIPARISAFLMMFAACLSGQNAKHAFQIWKRDRYNHASPNSAQTESVAAGALDILLAGDAWYFGKLVKKPTIGEDLRTVEAADIMRINRMMIIASLIALVLFLAVRCCYRIYKMACGEGAEECTKESCVTCAQAEGEKNGTDSWRRLGRTRGASGKPQHPGFFCKCQSAGRAGWRPGGDLPGGRENRPLSGSVMQKTDSKTFGGAFLSGRMDCLWQRGGGSDLYAGTCGKTKAGASVYSLFFGI